MHKLFCSVICILPFSVCFLVTARAQALLTLPQPAASNAVYIDHYNLSTALVTNERKNVYTQIVVKYNWGKMLQDMRLLLR
jgi:hypothetical protein